MNILKRTIQNNLSLFVTILLFSCMFLAGGFSFTGFFSTQILYNLFIDNAFLIITAAGMTMVIITGGIDLSVGSVIALSTMIISFLVEIKGVNPIIAIGAALLFGTVLGFIHGVVISLYKIPPFIATLAGMFLARGLCYIISTESISISNETMQEWALHRIPFIDGEITVNVVIAVLVVLFVFYLLTYTRFGRRLYAIGGNENSALLMGLEVPRTKILVYTLNGLLASLSGLVFSLYMLSGYALHAQGAEMDAIAGSVIGGTLLSGGVGNVIGTAFGVLVLGIIQTLIMFQGTLNSWWTRIVIGGLLLAFILFQTFFIRKKSEN